MKAQYSVRLARPSDLPRILAIERASFGEWAWDRKLFAEYLSTCGSLFLVAENEDRVAGYSITCITRSLLKARAELDSIAVAPAARGTGAADELLRATLRRLKRLHIPRLQLTVKATNDRAQAFYRRYGFCKVRRLPRYYEDGEDGFLFRLDL
jgi:[ribosomal protein S18]-alanine N-acetyltransferase